MRRRIACLHTAESNILHFDRAADGLGLDLRHRVRPDLLNAAQAAETLTPNLVAATAEALLELAGEADLVLLTCSTLGPIADHLDATVPIRRADRALAEEAIAKAGKKAGSRVAILYTLPTTAQATGALFREVADGTGVSIDLSLVAGAWDAFKADDQQLYAALIAEAADRAFTDGAAAVALAQASMAPAADLCRKGVALASPKASLAMAAG
jgi:Asp/Glu/hydantoin racemase